MRGRDLFEAPALYDACLADEPVPAECRAGQLQTLPARLEPPVREGVGIDTSTLLRWDIPNLRVHLRRR